MRRSARRERPSRRDHPGHRPPRSRPGRPRTRRAPKASGTGSKGTSTGGPARPAARRSCRRGAPCTRRTSASTLSHGITAPKASAIVAVNYRATVSRGYETPPPPRFAADPLQRLPELSMLPPAAPPTGTIPAPRGRAAAAIAGELVTRCGSSSTAAPRSRRCSASRSWAWATSRASARSSGPGRAMPASASDSSRALRLPPRRDRRRLASGVHRAPRGRRLALAGAVAAAASAHDAASAEPPATAQRFMMSSSPSQNIHRLMSESVGDAERVCGLAQQGLSRDRDEPIGRLSERM